MKTKIETAYSDNSVRVEHPDDCTDFPTVEVVGFDPSTQSAMFKVDCRCEQGRIISFGGVSGK